MPEHAFAAIGDRLTQALIGGDFDIYNGLFALPVQMKPRSDVSYLIQTEAELRADFELYHRNVIGRDVTDIFRQILDFTVLDLHRVKVRVLTHIMVRAQRIVDPFETHFFLVEQPDAWRIYEVESSGSHINWTLGRSDTQAGSYTPKREGDADGKA